MRTAELGLIVLIGLVAPPVASAEPTPEPVVVASERLEAGPMIITPVPTDARPMTVAEIRQMVRDRILLIEFAQFENLRTLSVDGAESEIEFFHTGGRWRRPGHWVSWREGRYEVANGELCVSYVDHDGPHRRCRAMYRAASGAVYARTTVEDGKRYQPFEKPALRAWTEPFSWWSDAPRMHGHGE